MSRIVSITPTSLDADSRTMKTASSLARMGHESVVVEGVRSSDPPGDAPFELVTISSTGEALTDSEAAGATMSVGFVEGIARVLGRIAGPVYFLASSAVFNLRTARRLPASDLYWLHGYDQAPAVWLRRTPYVYDAHDFYPALPFDGRRLALGERATHRVRERIERRCVRRAAARVTTSATMARLYEHRYGSAFEVVVNAQDTRTAQPAEGDVRAAAGLGSAEFVIAMVGNHKPGTVLPAQLPPGVHVVVVGAGYDDVEAPAQVHTVGPVPADQVAGFLRTADASGLFYVPVNENSQAQLVNGLFHAVAAGLPLLYPSGMDAIREVCERHGLGVAFDPDDPASLTRAIEELRSGMDELRRAVAAARPDLEWAHEEPTLAAVVRAATA